MKSELTVPLIQLVPWRAPAECELPEALRPWLLEADSMTRRLRHHNRHFSVQLLGNHSVTLCADEQQLVAAEQPMGLCREVILHGDRGPAVLGWTLFAEAALQESGLGELGEQPLGERIFGDEPARRDHLQLACFEIASNPWCPAATVWGRRSRLFLGQWPLLVHELFLPSLSRNKELE
ncbi:chorismate--pyruvate lyase [Aeromonas salmonicida]|uniref:Probable chorismate pyruvate-lyase n=1 Tax=Aeromonas salmonicida subsp. pectinolytica 34mel TaxID=1324960 RepID=A0A2D1QAI1_AERSA|nr:MULTISPECIES: chorismate lyase [Aeromonas]ATP07360.1 putative chorismate pyruvate-lyase [Aeromonas salmonicida subsp. pectinolytica 34mel]TNI10287.1 chorismate--pyruvate lyase [Aeromonas salmonicida]UUI60935.1 chorismate lyase [Aeromonas salmonicida]HEH9414947.1 chorismate lyase [Aeromonas salmonicida]HEH9423727.1 chorismate lyase [Aeromonas salmonicida]